MKYKINIFINIIIIFLSCETRDNLNPLTSPQSQTDTLYVSSTDTLYLSNEETYFVLFIDVNNYNFDNYDTFNKSIEVGFWSSNISIIPTVTINGTTIQNFYVDYWDQVWILFGNSPILPYQDIVNYSISANNKTTSGSIALPSIITNVKCNGSLMEEYKNNENYWDSAYILPPLDSYTFTWDCNEYDYFRIIWEDEHGYDNIFYS